MILCVVVQLIRDHPAPQEVLVTYVAVLIAAGGTCATDDDDATDVCYYGDGYYTNKSTNKRAQI